jgi:rhamnulokinase
VKSFHIAIDLGASGGRVALGWLESEKIEPGKLEVVILHRFWNGATPIRGALYWDIIALWREIRHGLQLAAARAKALGGTVLSIGVDSWAVDYALLDESDALIDGVRCYRDPRTDGLMDAVAHSRTDIFALTGLQFLPFNTLYQLLATPKPHLERAKTLLLVPDLLHFWLTGQKVCERTNASTTQFYDANTKNWAFGLLETLGLPHHFLPPIVDAGTVLGSLEAGLAAELKLEDAVVIAVGTHDTASAVAAIPLSDSGSAYISSGTWSLIGLETERAVMSAAALEANLTNEAGVGGTNRLLKNVMGLWILQECRRAWGDPDWAVLYQEAEHARAPTQIDPDDARYLHPGLDMPSRVAAHLHEHGIHGDFSRGEMVRCILESLAAKYALVLQQLEQVSGVTVKSIYVVGGGSQVTLLNQLTANATGRGVIAGMTDATLNGNLSVQLEALHLIAPGFGRQLMRASHSFKSFEPQQGE